MSTPSSILIGADEVGTGALAGPAYVCAVAAPVDWVVQGLNDSKQLAPSQREEVYARLYEARVPMSLALVTAATIDQLGLRKSIVLAFRYVVEDLLRSHPGADVVIDGDMLVSPGWRSLPKADAHFPAVMAASVVAKVNRDHAMQALHNDYPLYGFDRHVGYGTPSHRAALRRHGPCPQHRRSFGVDAVGAPGKSA